MNSHAIEFKLHIHIPQMFMPVKRKFIFQRPLFYERQAISQKPSPKSNFELITIDLLERKKNFVILNLVLFSFELSCFRRDKTKCGRKPSLNNNSVALVSELPIPTERTPLVGKVSANFCGERRVA
jgi:hypothetical protein